VRRGSQGQGFPPCLRLRRAQEFRQALGSRRRSRGEWFHLSFSENTWGKSRLGIVVARRIVPRAVDRNWLKRVARETFRRAAARLPPVDLVIQVKQAPVGSDARRLARAELQRLLAQFPR
jgi:ribonuclease P protein component